jgi:ribonuclease-3
MVVDVTRFEEESGLRFNDKTLLKRAFVHRSYVNENGNVDGLTDNERLEFLGDSVLNFVASEELYQLFPEHQEGALTSIRSTLVRREMLANFAIQLKLGDYLLLGHGEEESGGRQRPGTLCAVFEALVGALYLDQGRMGVYAFVWPLMAKELAHLEQTALEKDAKSRLQEYVQRSEAVTPKYRMIESVGPDHAKTFYMKVLVGERMIGVGTGRSKQEATQQAAAMALQRLGQYAPEYLPNPEVEVRYGLANRE